ncbi:VP4 [Hirame aquareovirus]|nr:VP4 [Hirame aquareovirus]
MITIVFIPLHGFSWHDQNILQYVDSRLTNAKIHKDRLSIFAPTWFKHQLETAAGAVGVEKVFELSRQLSSPLVNHFVLLPRPKALARWLLKEPSANIWSIPRSKLLLAEQGKAPPDLYDDIFPLLGPHASLDACVSHIRQHKLVYTRTLTVFGGPLKLATSKEAYSGFVSPSALANIYPADHVLHVPKRTELHLTIVPNLDGPKRFLLLVDNQSVDSDYPLSPFLATLTRFAENHLKGFQIESLLWRLLKGTPKPTWDPSFDASFKALRLSRPAQSRSPPIGSTITICNLDITLYPEPSDTKSVQGPLALTVVSTPLALLERFKLDVPGTYPLRQDDGTFVPWFVTLGLMSDGFKVRGSNRPVMLQTAHGESHPWWEVHLHAVRNPRSVDVRHDDIKDVTAVAITLPKGSFKSTVIRELSRLTNDDPAIFDPSTVTDSDELGDALSPSFETQVMTAWSGLPDCALEISFRSVLGVGLPSETFDLRLFDTFLALYKEVMVPLQRSRARHISQRGRSLAFGHNPFEFLAANVPIQVIPSRIPFDSTLNILSRPARVGGVVGQILLDHCYALLSVTLAPTYVGRIYRNLFGPWLELQPPIADLCPITLNINLSAHDLRKSGWTIDGDAPIQLIFLTGYVLPDSAVLDKCPIKLASRATVVCASKDMLSASFSPPIYSRTLPSDILLPVTSRLVWSLPSRVILSGDQVSLKGAVSWESEVTPLSDGLH